MKKIAGLLVIVMFLVLYLVPKVSEAKLGVFVGPFGPSFEEVNRALDGAVNKEHGTKFRFKDNGLALGIAAERGGTRVDISFYQVETSGSYACTDPSPEDCPNLRIERDVDAELKITAIPAFFTKMYRIPSKGNLSLRLGAGLGTVLTDFAISRRDTVYFIHPDGYVQSEKKESFSQHFLSVPLAGQVLAGVEYKLGRRVGFSLEARYIVSSKANIRNEGFESSIDWSGFSYRIGLRIGF